MSTDEYNAKTTTYYPQRFLARVIDLMVVTLVFLSLQVFSTSHYGSFLRLFWGYSLTCAFFGQPTLGKYLFALKIDAVKGKKRLFIRCIIRELLFLLLLPILFLNLICGSERALHDRICNTTIVSNGLKYS